MTARYPVAIEVGSADAAYGVVVPDLPGCFSAGDTLDEAMGAAEEAMAAWIDSALDDGEAIPAPSPLRAIGEDPLFAGWSFGVVSVLA
jgi:predicted RNase H-like HicB family nuclease